MERRVGDGSDVDLSGWGPPWKFLSGGCRANDRGGQGFVGKLMQLSVPLILALLKGAIGIAADSIHLRSEGSTLPVSPSQNTP